MTETLFALSDHLKHAGCTAKIVVWAHNSHLGARATEMGRRGEWNVGQLVRVRAGDDAKLIGFTTYSGTVTATSNWDEMAQRRPFARESTAATSCFFIKSGLPRFFLDLGQSGIREPLALPRLGRAIGVIYRPQTERVSHYFNAQISEQFDGVIHFDVSRAVEPMDRTPVWTQEDVPETFPEGL